MHIVKPIITEKSMRLAEENNMYTFEVNTRSNKTEAAKELENLFGVKVSSVRSHVRLGKKVRFGRSKKPGLTADRKIMVFKLSKGQIDIFRS